MQSGAEGGAGAAGGGGVSRGRRANRRRGAVGFVLRALEVIGWVAFFVFAAVFFALRYWLLPDIERYRADIVAEFSRSIGLPVKIGSIDAGWQGFRPQIRLNDVHILDREGRDALTLPSIDSVVSWRSLLFLDLRLHSISIDSLRLTVRRDASGAFYAAGIRLGQGAGAEGGFAAWVLDQREIVMRDAEVQWIDEQRGAPPLKLSHVRLRLRNSGNEHALGLAANPPPELGAGLDVRVELNVDATLPNPSWRARVYAELGYTDLSGWRTWIDYPVDVQAGHGALRLWATIAQGGLREITADVALVGARARLGPDLPVIDLASVQGRLYGRTLASGYEFGGRDLALEVTGGPVLRPTSFSFSFTVPGGGAPRRGTLNASLIEIRPLAALTRYLPVPADVGDRIAELGLKGELRDVTLNWTGPPGGGAPDSLAALQLQGRGSFVDLAMNAWHGVPAFSGLSGSVQASRSGGSVSLRSTGAEIDLPQVFPDPRLMFNALDGRVDWRVDGGDRVDVTLSSVSFSNSQLAGDAFGSYTYTGTGPGLIDLTARLTRADGRYTEKYLPLASIMGEGPRNWLARGIQEGKASDVRLRLYGDLKDFPFPQSASGQFLITARVTDGVLDYAPGWPRIENIDGSLVFERDRIDIVGRRARTLGVDLSDVHVSISSLVEPHTSVRISGEAQGATGRFLAFVRESPVSGMIDGATNDFSATGYGRLRLNLMLPLDNLAKSEISGEYRFGSNSIRLMPGVPPIEDAGGRVAFSESTLDVDDVTGRAFGGPVTISGGLRPKRGLRIEATGEAHARGLASLVGRQWAGRISGSTAYTATLRERGGRTELAVESSLRGLGVALPAPFAKRVDSVTPLRVTVGLGGGAKGRISGSYGRVLAFEASGAGGPAAGRRISLAVNPVADRPLRRPDEPGLLVYGKLADFDFEPWRSLLEGDGPALANTVIDLDIGVLDGYGRRLNRVALKARTEHDGWSADVRANELSGHIDYSAEGRGKLVARLEHFMIPGDSPGPHAESRMADWPSIDLATDRFEFRNKQLGRVELVAEPTGSSLRVDKLTISNPDASASAKGSWREAAPAGSDAAQTADVTARTSIEFSIDAKDAGGFLDRIGYPGMLRGGRTRLAGNLAWNGDPYPIDYATLDGSLKLHASDGQFRQIDPGLGKLVSLMSLQMLPRRLTLDFRDVFSKGFEFDEISSSLQVKAGVMRTEDFRMKGSAADVAMQGEVDVAHETQNLVVRVVPSLGDSACTAAILANPVTGIATCLAMKVFDNPLGKIFAYEYAVSGTWTDPKVVKVTVNGAPAATDGGS